MLKTILSLFIVFAAVNTFAGNLPIGRVAEILSDQCFLVQYFKNDITLKFSRTNLVVISKYNSRRISGIVKKEPDRSNTYCFQGKSLWSLIAPGDYLYSSDHLLDFDNIRGSNQIFKYLKKNEEVELRHRALFFQGITIGETAETLKPGDLFFHIAGATSIGITNDFVLGTNIGGFFLDTPNGNIKYKVFENESDAISLGLSGKRTHNESATSLNVSFYWDSKTSDYMTTHTFLSFAVANISSTEQQTVAIKSAGSSTLQTGYEYLRTNWDRVLFGPSYNIELKSVGGYLAYQALWSKWAFELSASTVNIREAKWDFREGYLLLAETYWLF